MTVLAPLAHAGHWLFALPPVAMVGALLMFAAWERCRPGKREGG